MSGSVRDGAGKLNTKNEEVEIQDFTTKQQSDDAERAANSEPEWTFC
jgi:hypothetical protein